MASQEPGSEPTPEAAADQATPWTPKVRKKFETKNASEFLDPCQEAAAKSIRCLHRNEGDRTMCQDYFQAYRDCKKLWLDKRRDERRKSGGWFS